MAKIQKAPAFTPAQIRKGLTSAKAAYSEASTYAERALAVCSAFTWSMFEANLIGADAPEGLGWKSQRDYAAEYGVTHTAVVMWRRYGRAASLGVDENTLRRIVQWFGDARISEALDTGSKAAITKAVKSITLPDGKRVPAPKSAKSTKPSSDTAKDGLPVTRNNSTTLDVIETVAARLTAKMSKAECARLASVIESLTERLAVAENGGKPVAVPEVEAA